MNSVLATFVPPAVVTSTLAVPEGLIFGDYLARSGRLAWSDQLLMTSKFYWNSAEKAIS